MSDLLPIALRALEDDDGLPVLGDAVLESGWWHEGVINVLSKKPVTGPKNYRRFLALAAAPTNAWARAVYSALLFEDWAGWRGWPVAERARRPPPSFEESPILGMLPKRDSLVDALAREQDALMASIAKQHSRLLYSPTPEETRRYSSDRTDAVDLALRALLKESEGQ